MSRVLVVMRNKDVYHLTTEEFKRLRRAIDDQKEWVSLRDYKLEDTVLVSLRQVSSEWWYEEAVSDGRGDYSG